MSSLEFQLAELRRQFSSMVQLGQIEEVDYDSARARVRIGDLLTGWLVWTTPRACGDVEWQAPEIGESVIIISPSGNLSMGVIIGNIYRDAFPANGDRATLRKVTFADGAVVEYDRAAHRFSMTIPDATAEVRIITEGKVTVAADGDVTIEAGGNAVLEAQGNLRLTGASITMEGPVTQTGGDLTSDGVSAQHHVHGGVESGGSSTAEPS